MDKTFLIEDAFAFAQQGLSTQGELTLAELLQLQADLPEQKLPQDPQFEPRITWSLQGQWLETERVGRSGNKGRFVLQLGIKAQLVLICQRCLQPFCWSLTQQNTLELVHSVEQLEQANDVGEVLLDDNEYIVADPSVNVYDLVQDELILSIPYAPKHDQCPSNDLLEEFGQAKKVSPFDILKTLKTD